MDWYDLYTPGRLHPRRFDRLEVLQDYLERGEGLSKAEIKQLLASGELRPAAAADQPPAVYRLTVLKARRIPRISRSSRAA